MPVHSSIPLMPVRHAPGVALIVYTALMIAVTVGFLAYWLLTPAERRVGPALPMLLIGGALSGLMESWLDNVVLVGYPPHQSLPVIHAFNRSVPIFVPIGYAWFCGGLLYLVARSFGRGITPRKIWGLYGAIVVVDFVAIGLSSWIKILQFYGHPPMDIGGYPLWWAGIDGLDVVLGGTIVFALLHRLRDRRQIWLILVPSIALGAAAGIVGWPISTALNSSWSTTAKYACALASIGLSLAVVTFLARTLPGLASYLHVSTREPAHREDDHAPPPTRSPVGAVHG
jgi:hypothetical protein